MDTEEFPYGRQGPILDPTTLERLKQMLLARMLPQAMAGQTGGLRMAPDMIAPPSLPTGSGAPLLGLRMSPSLYSSGQNGLPPAPTTPYYPR